jgi:hypothetical protein
MQKIDLEYFYYLVTIEYLQLKIDYIRYASLREPPFEDLPSRASGSNDRV